MADEVAAPPVEAEAPPAEAPVEVPAEPEGPKHPWKAADKPVNLNS